MPLTPSDVEQMTFTTALRGYDLDEVDDFLDQVVIAIRDFDNQMASAKSKMTDLERRADSVGADESAVGRALVAAQETADKILGDARAESEAILSTARSGAESYENEQRRLREESDAEMAEHAGRIADVRGQLALLATQVADRLDEMDAKVSAVVLSGSGSGSGSGNGEDSPGDEPGLDADPSQDTPDDDYDMGDYEDDADSSHDSPDDNNTEVDESESDSKSDDVDSESDSKSGDDKFGDAGDSDY